MRFNVFILALVLHHSHLGGYAYPPTYSDEPPAVGDSGGGGQGYGYGYGHDSGYNTPPQRSPVATYITTSTTSSTSSAASSTKQATQASMQPAFAYEAAVPTHVEAGSDGKVTVTATHSNGNSERDGELSKKIIGSSVVTSVSVILNGNEPQFTDALGHKVPKPLPSLQVASPINLLNPDRYEFYTFDDNGELVKRLMTMKEIQSIVANGDGEGPSIIHTAPIIDRDPEKNVQDIVNSVQDVLNKERESSKNSNSSNAIPILDTPDVSSSWSMILPAIFGNTGGDIFPQQKPQQIVMTPDSELLETSTKAAPTTTRTTKKPKPNKRKPGQKRKPTTTTTQMTPQQVQEELGPLESVYTGMQQYQNIASNMQNFDGFSQMHMQPIYHKIPEAVQQASTPETTTRRVFVNNQEVIKTNTSQKNDELSASLGKKPIGVGHKQPPPHRNKTPNHGASTTTRPQVTHTKQKIKKKPRPTTSTTTPAPITTTTLAPTTTTTTTTTPAPTTTTTTTTPAPTTTPTPTTAAPPPASTTPKKKRKKPTRQPIHQSAINGTHTRPHLTADKRRPTPRPDAHHRPRPTHIQQQQHNKHRPSSDLEGQATVNQETTHKYQQVNHHNQRPRPHRPTTTKTTTTSSTTTTPAPTTTANFAPVPQTEDISLIVQEYPGYVGSSYAAPAQSSTTSTSTKAPTTVRTTTTTTTTKAPTTTSTTTTTTTRAPTTTSTTTTTRAPTTTSTTTTTRAPTTTSTTTTTRAPTTTSTTTTTRAPTTTTTTTTQATTTTRRPSFAGSVSYPYPAYNTDQQEPPFSIEEEDKDIGQFKKKPLPSLAMIQQQLQQEQKPETHVDEDLHTLLSFDQIMQSLKGDEVEKSDENHKKTEESTKPVIMPVKYDSAESVDQLEEMVNKKKVSVVAAVPATTNVPLMTAHYGGSTLGTMISEEEDALTGRPIMTTDSSMEDTTYSEEDNNTPVVIITQRPQFFANTKKPEMGTTNMPQRTDEPEQEKTEVPNYTQFLGTTENTIIEKEEMKQTTPATTTTTTAKSTDDQSHVFKLEPLYADVQEPLVTEQTTSTPTAVPMSTIGYDVTEDDTTVIEMNESQTDANIESVEKENASTTQTLIRLPVTVPQKIESIIAGEEDTTEIPALIADLKPHLNLEVLRPTEPITMSDFQTQAATVASTLVDGTNTIASEIFMNSNETKDELEFLMSDFIKKITNQHMYPSADSEDSNRLTNFAQLNSSFMMNPVKVATMHKETSSSIASYGSAATTVSMDMTTEIPKTNKKPEEMPTEVVAAEPAYKPEPVYVPLPTIAPYADRIETSSGVPSNEELIEKEEEFMDSLKKHEDALSTSTTHGTPIEIIPEVETTTFKIPILSLSQIYAQQQQAEDEMEGLFETQNHETIKSTEASLVSTQYLEEDLTTEQIEITLDEMEDVQSQNSKVNGQSEEIKSQEENSAEEKLTEEKSTEEKLTEDKSTEEKLTEDNLTEDNLTEDKLTEDNLTEDKLTEEKLTEEVSTEQNLTEEKSNEEQSTEVKSTEDKSVEESFTEEMPTELNLTDEKLTEEKASEEKPTEDKSTAQTDAPVNEKPSSEKTSSETESTEINYVSIVPLENQTEGVRVEDKDQENAITEVNNEAVMEAATILMDTNEESTEKEASQGSYATMINGNESSLEKEATEQVIVALIEEYMPEIESTEQNYATMINANKLEDEKDSMDANISENTEESFTPQLPLQSSVERVTENVEDSVTSAVQLQPQYISEPVMEMNTESEEKIQGIEPATETTIESEEKPQESVQVTETISQQSESGSVEQSTEIPGVTAIVLTESDIEHSNEKITEKYEKTTMENYEQPETDEATSEEMMAMISEEDETSEDFHGEDPYVKLGEVTQKPAEQTEQPKTEAPKTEEPKKESDETTLSMEDEDIPEILHPTLPHPLQTEEEEEEEPIVNGHQAMMPIMNYGQLAEGEVDEEDEDDQIGYQPPGLPFSSTSSSTTSTSSTTTSTTSTTTTSTTSTPKPTTTSTTKRLNTLKPVSYYKQPAFGGYNQPEPPKVITYVANAQQTQQRPMQRPPALSNLMATSTQATRPPVKLEPSPDHSKGLEASTLNLDEDVREFARLCNELAFSYWKSITSEKISSARSLVLSPFALTSMLSMVFLGARGGTSGEMNEVLKLDDMVTFNPHLVFKNITDSVEKAIDSDIATTAFVREIFSDRSNGKILQFFKEKTQQLYAGHVEEVNFHVVNDIIRRRTNLLVKRHTMGKVLEYLRTNSVWVNGPLATISANLFQTDCTRGSTHDRDGEMFFQVHPTVRQRRLVPIPAVLYKSGFTAGYEPKLDATVVAFGRIQDTVSTIYVMPGHQSSISPTDNLDRLERELVELAFSENAWSNLLTALMDRPGMEVQLPRFSHRSFVNASLGLQKMGLKGLFKSDLADLRGLTGSSNRDIYLSDMIQINTFSTCGEEKISDHHHVEMYPAPPLRKRNKDVDALEDDALDSSESVIDFGSLVQDSALGRGFYDDLLDPKYLELPLPLRPRQARVPDAPRLRFDKPFLYFVRHNPTGMILFMGRFNPRLLP